MPIFERRELSVYSRFGARLTAMRVPVLPRVKRICLWLALDLLVAACALGFVAWADTSAKPHQVVGGCYCGCGMSKTAAGCSKICDRPKFAARRWAVTCAKPRVSTPAETPSAHPHLHYNSRSERASN